MRHTDKDMFFHVSLQEKQKDVIVQGVFSESNTRICHFLIPTLFEIDDSFVNYKTYNCAESDYTQHMKNGTICIKEAHLVYRIKRYIYPDLDVHLIRIQFPWSVSPAMFSEDEIIACGKAILKNPLSVRIELKCDMYWFETVPESACHETSGMGAFTVLTSRRGKTKRNTLAKNTIQLKNRGFNNYKP